MGDGGDHTTSKHLIAEDTTDLTTADLTAADRDIDAVLAIARRAERQEVELLDALVDLADEALYLRDGASSLTAWLRRRAGTGATKAHRLVRQVAILRRLPQLRGALNRGTTSLAHAGELARVATPERQWALAEFSDQLVGFACSLSPEDFSRACEEWAEQVDQHTEPRDIAPGRLRFTPLLFGEADIEGRLSADQASVIGEALSSMNGPDPADAPVRRTLRERNADALADMAQRYLDSRHEDRGGDHRPQSGFDTRGRHTRHRADVIIDLDTLLWRTPDLWADGNRQVVLDAVRRSNADGRQLAEPVADLLLCDATVRRLVEEVPGRPLDIGRSQPVVSGAQRRALVYRDGGCVFPTCTAPAHFCDAHHLVHWRNGGPTDLDNLVLLCRHHHRLVHGDTWNVARNPTTGDIAATRIDRLGLAVHRRNPTGTVQVVAYPTPEVTQERLWSDGLPVPP